MIQIATLVKLYNLKKVQESNCDKGKTMSTFFKKKNPSENYSV
jgi:hypothetical protein